MNAPFVSVVIPTHNRADLLPRAIDSVVGQTFRDWQLVVVDDGSVDDTPAVLERYARRLGDRFIGIRQSHGGSSAARNAGIEAGRGRYVAFLDSDDEFRPDKLARQIELFRGEPGLGFVFCDYAYVDLKGRRHDSAFDTIHALARDVPAVEIAPRLFVCGDELFDRLIRRYFIATITGMVRRDVLGNSVRFSTALSYAEEWLFFLQIAARCRGGFVDEPLCLHHHTHGSLARTDPAQNAVGYRKVLCRIDRTFQDLTRPQRRAVRENLAVACRQVGYDAYHSGAFASAAARFRESLSNRMHLATLVAWAEAGVRGWLQRRAHATKPTKHLGAVGGAGPAAPRSQRRSVCP